MTHPVLIISTNPDFNKFHNKYLKHGDIFAMVTVEERDKIWGSSIIVIDGDSHPALSERLGQMNSCDCIEISDYMASRPFEDDLVYLCHWAEGQQISYYHLLTH